jgi:transcriptional regulator with PAS, ATPase and Fis domain
MNEALNQTQLAASSESFVLFLGESGSGKDFMARYLHEHSARANGPFFSINCAALPEDLVESELFGHERGAFTGAGVRKRGLVELAEGGTLLLNEIGELPARLQAKLLSFLDTQSFIRVGGEKEIFVDCRIVAATNRDLQKEFEMGNFRQDLFYRLNVFSITVPPLRDRLDDLELLVHELYDAICTKMACTCLPQVEHQFIERLKNYSWPGNIRELRNVLERALILSPDYFMSADLIDNALNLGTTIPIKPGSSNDNGIPYNEAVANLKKKLILNALEKSSGNIKRASEILQITRDSLIHQMKSVGLRK